MMVQYMALASMGKGYGKYFHNKATRFQSLVRLGYPTSQNNNFAKLDRGQNKNNRLKCLKSQIWSPKLF